MAWNPRALPHAVARRFGLQISRLPRLDRLERTHADMDAEFLRLWPVAQPYTMTSIEKGYSLWRAVRYIEDRAIRGDIVECGVWKGGSMLLAGLALQQAAGASSRRIYLFDTFEGMSQPSEVDVSSTGFDALVWWRRHGDDQGAIVASLNEVETNLARLDRGSLVFVKGKVEDTIPAEAPDRLALLRIDTDWYESTLHELTHLWPRLEPGGVLIIDDYATWAGARKAVDEFVAALDEPPLLHRIDAAGMIAVKA